MRKQMLVRCQACAYLLYGLDGMRCPECGCEFDPADGRTVRLPEPRTISGRFVIVLIASTLMTAVTILQMLKG
jgi:hypothetical protein